MPANRPFHGTPLYETAALRMLEQRAAAEQGGDAFELMRRAGQAAWRFLLQHWPQAQRIIVVCGPGNNGGDGYVLARHACEAGRDARVVRLPGDVPRSELAQRACRDFEAAHGRIETFTGVLPAADVVVDALFGIGLSRAPDRDAAALIGAINATSAVVWALDVPSGVDADRGSVASVAVRASRCLQFIAPHAGVYTGAALDHVGVVSLAPLDVPQRHLDDIAAAARLWLAGDLPQRFAPRPRNAHKGDAGRVLCIGGDHGMGGAIALCAEAALRAGAGLVSVATRAAHLGAVLARRPELMVHAIEEVRDASLTTLLERADVVAAGPGIGRSEWGTGLLAAAVASGRPLVLDADALNGLARQPRALAPGTILTPHPGEAARLLGATTSADVQNDRRAAAHALCERYGCVVVLKGAGTIVAQPGAMPCVIGAGNPGMAVGGMGDVLTGVIAALRAQGMDAFDAACTGALLHAAAGDAAARDGGERGLLPSDLFPHLRRLANP